MVNFVGITSTDNLRRVSRNQDYFVHATLDHALRICADASSPVLQKPGVRLDTQSWRQLLRQASQIRAGSAARKYGVRSEALALCTCPSCQICFTCSGLILDTS